MICLTIVFRFVNSKNIDISSTLKRILLGDLQRDFFMIIVS